MFPPVNVSPVEELLTDVVSPERLAQIVDDICFDYVHALFVLLSIPNQKRFILSEKTADYIYYLRTIRDAFRECEVKQ